MDKRDFLKASGSLVAGTVISSALGTATPAKRTNWAGNYEYFAKGLDQPRSLEELQQVIRSRPKLKALGARHSFNSIADTHGDQISLAAFDNMSLDREAKTVTVGAGVTYGRLAPYLDTHGFALHNLASLPHISVVGACATATHGSGSKNGNLTTAVSAFELVTADGQVRRFSKHENEAQFRLAAVGLGALGVITNITLNVEPTFAVRQFVYENLPFSELEHNLEKIFSAAYSVSLFTDWQNERATQVWLKSRTDRDASTHFAQDFYGAKLASRKLHPLAGHSAENCTEQGGVPGPWHERLPHFRMNFTPSSGDELQSEYFVPREKGYQAIRAIERLRNRITPHLFISEFRTIAADELPMSPCCQQPSMTIHFTWKPEWAAVKQILPAIEAELLPLGGRPHWGKLFTVEPARLQSAYSSLPAFRDLAHELDPSGKFRNPFLAADLYSS